MFSLFSGGDQCHDGKHARSTRITLSCSQYDAEPIFIEETASCEYVFMWHTPFACPKHVLQSETCQIQDPLYNYTFDLSPLRNPTTDYSTNDGTTQYFVNVCGPVVGSYDQLPSNTSVVIKKQQFLSGGSNNATLIFNDGTLTMQFTNGSMCDNNTDQSSSKIIFMCDHEVEDPKTGLSVFRHPSSCQNNFVWRTKYACPPHTVIDCSYTTKDGLKYDLNPLSLSSMNQEERAGVNERFVLNVCRSVVNSKSARCPYDSATCLIDDSNKNESLNLGSVGRGPYIDHGRLKLKYENGDVCKSDSSKNYTTEIYFECDTFDYYPYPNLIAREECKYVFEWKTKFACPEKLEPVSTKGNCSALNIFTNNDYDLSSLFRSEPYEVKGQGVTMKLNVCGPVNDPSCPDSKSGACVKADNDNSYTSAGVANAELQSTLTLVYNNGSPCSNGVNRSTIISFFCGAENSVKGPVLVSVDNDSCTYFVNWHTELACNYRMECIARGHDSMFDLRSLIKHRSNYKIAIRNEEGGITDFYMNVCRPVNHIIGTNCVAGSSLCMVERNSTSGKDVALSLGKPLMPLISGSDVPAMLLYTLGSQCRKVPGFMYTSRIKFVCDRAAGPVRALSD